MGRVCRYPTSSSGCPLHCWLGYLRQYVSYCIGFWQAVTDIETEQQDLPHGSTRNLFTEYGEDAMDDTTDLGEEAVRLPEGAEPGSPPVS